MGRRRTPVLRLWPADPAGAKDQRSLHSAAGPDDAVVAAGAEDRFGRSKKTSTSTSASTDPPFGNTPPLLCPPSLRAAPGCRPTLHPILPAMAARPSALPLPAEQQRSTLARPPLAAASLVAGRPDWSVG